MPPVAVAPPVTRSQPTFPGSAPAPSKDAAAQATLDLVVRTALQLRGTPYHNGGSDPRGFDCSGFTQYVFAQAGRALPRDTREQFSRGESIAVGQQQAGDLVFFATTGPDASHVGIALGGDDFVHAPSSRGVVRVESMALPYWSRRIVGIRRVVGN